MKEEATKALNLEAQTAATQHPAFPQRTHTDNFRISVSPYPRIPATMRKLASSLLVALVALAPSLAHAQNAAAHPDFNGTWVMDTAQSDKGQMIPQKMTLKITQTPAAITVDRQQTSQMGEMTSSMKYATDGSTSKNQLTMQGNPVDVSTVVTWEGAVPVFTSSMSFGGNDAQSVEKWSLSGKNLTVNRTVSFGGQEFSSKLVLVKQ